MIFVSKPRNLYFGAFLLLLLGSGVLVFAQDEKRDIKVLQEQVKAGEKVSKAAEEAEEKRTLEGVAKINYEAIMNDPDNVELNFRYANQQIDDNNLVGASATLERILMLDPKLTKVRFFYAVVLYRLDNLKEAEREIQTLLKMEIPKDLRGQLEIYLNKIHLSRKMTRLDIRQTDGFQFDDNRNASPHSKQKFSNGTLADVTGTDVRRDDTSFLNITNATLTHDLGFQAGHDVYASFTYYLQEQTVVDNLDLSSFIGEVGGTYKSKWVNLTPKFYYSHTLLSRETYLRTPGMGITIDRDLTKRLSWSSLATLERQSYNSISDSTTAYFRKGRQIEVESDVSYLLNSTMKVTIGASFTDKNAVEGFNAYDGLGLKATYFWLPGKGQFIVQTLDADFDYYNESDPTVLASRDRWDKSLRYRVTYGAPLTTLLIGKILPRPMKDITLTLTYEFSHTYSNVTNYTYSNSKYQLSLIKAWSF